MKTVQIRPAHAYHAARPTQRDGGTVQGRPAPLPADHAEPCGLSSRHASWRAACIPARRDAAAQRAAVKPGGSGHLIDTSIVSALAPDKPAVPEAVAAGR